MKLGIVKLTLPILLDWCKDKKIKRKSGQNTFVKKKKSHVLVLLTQQNGSNFIPLNQKDFL